jgi:hypothetical protein
MPRCNEKHESIQWMETNVKRLKKHAMYRELLDVDDSLEEYNNLMKIQQLRRMKSCRYLFRKQEAAVIV